MKQHKEIKGFFNLIKTVFLSYFEERAHLHAATVSYYTLFSMIPLLYLTVVSFGWIFGEAFCLQVISELFRKNIGLSDIHVFTDIIKNIHEQAHSWVLNMIMIVTLLYSCSAFMVSLKHSINEFFDVAQNNQPKINIFLELFKFRLLSLSYLAFIALVVFLLYFLQLFAFNVVASWFSTNHFSHILVQMLFSFTLNYLIVLLLFKFVNDANVPWSVVGIGTLVTAVFLLLSQLLIKWYLQHYFFLGKSDIIGSIFILMAWVFYSSQVVFLGAKFTYIYGKYTNKS